MPGAPVSVGQARGDDQLAAAAGLHALHALVPAGDDLPGAEPELQRIAPVPARIELFPGGVRDPDIVDPDDVAGLRLAAITFPDVGDLQFGRGSPPGKSISGLWMPIAALSWSLFSVADRSGYASGRGPSAGHRMSLCGLQHASHHEIGNRQP